jgi:hypothetical protein
MTANTPTSSGGETRGLGQATFDRSNVATTVIGSGDTAAGDEFDGELGSRAARLCAGRSRRCGLGEGVLPFRLGWSGTPAPIAPTEYLVVGGSYRYVRNPMYVAVVAVIVGQALAFWSMGLLGYALLVWLLTAAFVRWYEEPVLHERNGASYELYCKSVGAWIPRLHPWTRP